MEKFVKTSESTIKVFEELTSNIQCEHKKMFGYPCLFVNGNMFCGTFADKIFVRIKIEQQKAWKDRYKEIKEFEPMRGKKMKEYLEIIGVEDKREIIKVMITDSIEYMKTLKDKTK